MRATSHPLSGLRVLVVAAFAPACAREATNDLERQARPDAGARDAIALDAQPDAPDGGPAPDACDPQIRVTPPDSLRFSNSRDQSLVIENTGCAPLHVAELYLTGPAGGPFSESIDDFSFVGCNTPCAADLELCPLSAPGCSEQATFELHYANNDLSNVDFAELHIASNDPADADHIVVVQAMSNPCAYPTPAIALLTPMPAVGQPIRLDGSGSTGGGAAITDYHWRPLFVPEVVTLTPPNTAQTSFTSNQPGMHIIGLDVTNACGSTSQQPAIIEVYVED